MRRSIVIALALVVLGGCAAPAPTPAPLDPNCATPVEGATDGGYGGTGNTPEGCPPQPRL